MKDWIIVDLDGTLCDCSHRVHLAQAKQWEEFHAGIPNDRTIAPTVIVVEKMAETHNVLLCTGRNEANRKATNDWLQAKMLGSMADVLLMRPDNDHRPDHELKLQLVYDYFGGKQNALDSVLVVLDDRDKVVEAWRDAGFTCWQVAAGSY